MAAYRLRIVYELRRERGGTSLAERLIEAATMEDAIARCREICIDGPALLFASAMLTEPCGRIAWSLQSARRPSEYAHFN